MVSKWFAWWNSIGLFGFVDYIRGKGEDSSDRKRGGTDITLV